MNLPRVLVVLLGGTIAMLPTASGGIAPTLRAEDLVANIPEIASVATVEALSLFGLPGASLTLKHLLELVSILQQRFDAGSVDGAVVVQGTDTIEDTAFVLDLLIRGEHSVVVTGAMRGAASPSADGSANLLCALRVATSKRTSSSGVVVVMNDEIHSARFVQKMHTSLLNAFESPGAGPLGNVFEGRVEFNLAPLRLPCLEMPIGKPIHKVALIPLGIGDDGRILTALGALGFSGAVVEGLGAGHVPQEAIEHVSALTKKMPVVLSTRVRAGRVFERTYDFSGSEMDLKQRGLLSAGQLSSSKARLLLCLLLSAEYSADSLRSFFDTCAFLSSSADRE